MGPGCNINKVATDADLSAVDMPRGIERTTARVMPLVGVGEPQAPGRVSCLTATLSLGRPTS